MEKHAALLEKLTAHEQAQQSLSRDLRLSLRTAEPLLRQGQFAEAAKHYEDIVRLLPTFYEAYFALGVCYSQTARSAQAETAFKKYLTFQPLSADGHAALGLLLTQQNRSREAKLELERALQLDPSLLEARKALARVHFSMNDFVLSVRELDQVLAAEPNADPELYVMLATSRFNLNEKEKAIETIERGLKVHPNSPAMENLHASLLLDCSRTTACKAKMIESLKQNPNSPSYLKGIGKLLLQEDPLGTQAEQLLTKVQQVMPADTEARYLYSQWAYLNNKHQLCIDELNKTLALPGADEQTRMQIYALMGMAEDALNKSEAAEAAFRKSLEFNRRLRSPSPYAALRYIEFLVKRARDAEAQGVIDDVLKWSPRFSPARFERAKFLAGQRQPERAIEEAKLVIQHSANDQNQLRAAHAFLAKTYFALGRAKDAQVHQSWIEAQSRQQP
ncbi:MAG: tetratricopeptide repeat protein [Pyrinomonadaceae bacterium]|nr:tetratricopeptide repeat protein [Pyrinomonadaceae bacterium]